jgi:hypothetical protein
MAPGLTVHERLLLAAADLAAEGKELFSAEDLVVAAWKRDPETFGLAGYVDDTTGRPRFPNSNRVFAEIMGSKPIRKQGLIVKAGTKMFRLTESGLQRARALTAAGDGDGGGARKATFSRQIAREFEKLLATRAVDKFLNDRGDEITFTDATSFWGISARSSAMELQGRIGHVEGILNAAADAAATGPVVLKHGSRPFRADDVGQLRALHEGMLDRFSDDLDFLRRRTDER